jgi:hypothetical protein
LSKLPRDEIAQGGSRATKEPEGKPGADEFLNNRNRSAMWFAPRREQLHCSRSQANANAINRSAGGIPRLHRKSKSLAQRSSAVGCARSIETTVFPQSVGTGAAD